jgi:cytochrome c-type biogenesis protein CcmH
MNRETLVVLAAAVAVAAAVAGGAAWYYQRSRPADAAPAADVATTLEGEVAALQARVDADPSEIDSWRALGRRFMTLERYLEAVEAWSVVAELRPGDPEAAAAFARLDEIASARGRHREQGR